MHLWQVTDDSETESIRHELAPGFGHSLLAPVVAYVFKVLGVSATLWEHAYQWLPLHTTEQNLLLFELEHGKEVERNAYNQRNF
ncbi:MAG TPA: hypothetical protein VGP93_16500, partial [Polyangiaceae bacterium]|nr:hypothetical protein [Polyangiaceae bacterium]